MVKVNGEEKQADGQIILEYLEKSGYNLERVAVELNGEILPKAVYGNVKLKDKDVVEVISFVGGG